MKATYDENLKKKYNPTYLNHLWLFSYENMIITYTLNNNMKKYLTFLILLFSFNVALSQTFFDKNGDAIGFIENGDFYYKDGSPIAYVFNNALYSYRGKLMFWISNNIIYDKEGYVLFFKKGAIDKLTNLEPIFGLKKLKPIKEIRETTEFSPIFKPYFSNTKFDLNYLNDYKQSGAKINPQYFNTPIWKAPNELAFSVLQKAQKNYDQFFERLANYISQERENNLLEEKHLEYFKRNQNDFVFNMTKSSLYSIKQEQLLFKKRHKRKYHLIFETIENDVLLTGYIGRTSFLSKKIKYKKYVGDHIFLSFKSDSNGFSGDLININDGSKSTIKYDSKSNILTFFEKDIYAELSYLN